MAKPSPLAESVEAASTPAEPQAPMDSALNDLIGYAMRRAQLKLFQNLISRLSAHDLRPAQFSALAIINQNPGLMQADLAPVLAKFKLESIEDLHLALALGDLGPSQVTRCLHDHAQAEKEPAEPAPLTRRSAPPPPPNAPFTVEGVGNLLSQIARCCQPVPGDPIVGYLTRGRGVSIHREGCPAAQRLLARQPDRFLPVEWGGARASSYEVDIVLHAFDRKWLLKDLTNVIAQLGVNILGIQSRVDEAQGLAELRLAVRVPFVDAAAILHPDPVAVAVPHAGFAFVEIALAPEVGLQALPRFGQIVGVGEPHPGVDGGRTQFVQRVADDPGPALVETGFPGLHVPLPGADVGALDDVLQPQPLDVNERVLSVAGLLERLLPVYNEILGRLAAQGVEWVQIDEPILTLDLPQEWKNAFERAYHILQYSPLKKLAWP